jgi:hypothetical protein
MSWPWQFCIDLTCVMAARERQRDKQQGIVTRRLSWPTVVLASGVLLGLAANLAQAQPTAWAGSWPPSRPVRGWLRGFSVGRAPRVGVRRSI